MLKGKTKDSNTAPSTVVVASTPTVISSQPAAAVLSEGIADGYEAVTMM